MIAASKLKMGHTNCDPDHAPFKKLRLYIVYLCAKLDDSSISRSRDITEPLKFKVGHVTLTTFLLRVICPQYVGT